MPFGVGFFFGRDGRTRCCAGLVRHVELCMGAAGAGQDDVDPRFVTERHMVMPPAEPVEAIPLEDPAEPAPGSDIKLCAACAHTMGRDSLICIHCGYDERQGFTRATSPGATHAGGGTIACPYCDYDLTGLKQLKCPECGNVIEVSDLQATPTVKKVRPPVVWREMRRPAIMLGIAMVINIIMMMLTGTPTDAIRYLLVAIVEAPCGLLAYWLIGVLWMGFDQPLPTVLLRLAAIYAVCDAVWAIGSLFIFILILWPIVIVVYVGLLAKELDVELDDAIFIAATTGVTKVFIGAAILAPLFKAFGL